MRLLLPTVLLSVTVLAAAEEPTLTMRMARMGSSELRAAEDRIVALRDELATLPPTPSDQSSERKGWHSSFSAGPDPAMRPKGLGLDLGRIETFDAVVLVPVNVAYGSYLGPGFGFPVRFRVEVADDPSFSKPVTLTDYTNADFSNPGSLPVFIESPHGRGRFVRITATRLFSRENDALLVLGEVMVMRGALNLATAATVIPTDSYDNVPTWQPENVNDGQSVLGPPLRNTKAPGNGYHAEIAKSADTVKWVQLDLGRSMPLEEVRLFAARPRDFAVKPGFGFPVRFRVEAGDLPDMTGAKMLADFTQRDCVNPGDNPFPVPGYGVNARYVRVTATRLWRRDDFVFALSEMQVFSGGANVALAAQASALDELASGTWSLQFINDGYTSQGELLDWAQWLRGLSRRREVEQLLAVLTAARDPLVNAAWQRLWWWGTAVGGLFIAALAAWAARQRRQRRIEVRRLRGRIAADLHDEIGSNLASIAILSHLSLENDGGTSRTDLAEINRIAQDTADSMRDIVWLMQPGPRNAQDLVTRMREIARRMLAGMECCFEAHGICGPFTLEFERETLLLFKEALHNIRKHSGARCVNISVRQEGRDFHLHIADDGIGFEPALFSTGIGLATMQQRAGTLGGALAVRTQPAAGTRIELHARLS